jgi:hypothetical protein
MLTITGIPPQKRGIKGVVLPLLKTQFFRIDKMKRAASN